MIIEAAVRRVHVIQGEYKVVNDPNVVLSTILGSCVAACLRDPVAGVGGMNHFLLPGSAMRRSSGGDATRYGVHLMELLINGLLKQGARRDRLEAKIFGGAKTIATLLQCRRAECGLRHAVPDGRRHSSRRREHRRRSRPQARILAGERSCPAIRARQYPEQRALEIASAPRSTRPPKPVSNSFE